MSKIEVNAIEPQCGTTLTVGASGDTITFPTGTTIVNNGTQTGFGRTGTVDWNTTPKTATFTAVSGDGFFANTTGSAFNMNLPAGVAGAIVSVADYAGTWNSNNLTVVPNGTDKIGSTNANATLSTKGQSVTFVYVDSTQGWINTMDSTSNVRGGSFICASVSGACNTLTTVDTNFKVAKFTGPGTFTVNSGAGGLAVADYVVVAGGGGGAGRYASGAGGAGGFRESYVCATSGPYTASPLAVATSLPLAPGAFSIVVGAGGGGGTPGAPSGPVNNGQNGNPSSFSTITSAGGGGGGSSGCTPGAPTGYVGNAGGSGGGSGYQDAGFGAGNSPPVSPPQGNNGGGNPSSSYGSGGGGATTVGATSTSDGGAGGAGATTNIDGTPTTRSGGGGGGADTTGGAAGAGGGGAGGGPAQIGTAGTVNTGGGAGGSGGTGGAPSAPGASGGSGIVIIRYRFQ